ncbi:uncharacterized protein [Physcomitrium patens]|uniref:Response regulatory domain-containing protein n=1 Tax=Physcomitrium patens TaxID=3218 RepID=A0A7I4DZC2_PHYPA|nr:hybrid signal transduction histidine kinase F-like [Physcomitrium patens]|eukprot:XP_024375476.1 hybrid signal transduction histidine kinase F-like [Physcomitrella patens]
MRRASTTLGHAAAVVMPGVVIMPLTAPDRLRLYRRCFHELEEQLLILQVEGREAEVRSLQAELRFLEELIMVFTTLNPASPNKQVLSPEVWMEDAAVEELDLSLVTDILLLSASSPWTVYIADRSQWLLCFASPSVKRTTGWSSQELVGTAAWGACHADDFPVVQLMLHLRDSEPSGGSVIYRRLRKDRSYVTVQATGRAIGTRWYAWVEQDILNFSPATHQEELSQVSQNRGIARSPKQQVVEGDIPFTIRPRRLSSPWIAPPEVPNPNWDPVAGGNRIVSATVAAPSLKLQSKGYDGIESEPDEVITVKPISTPVGEACTLELQPRSQEVATIPTMLSAEAEQSGACSAPIRSSNIEAGDTIAKLGKSKGAAPVAACTFNSRLDEALPTLDGKELIQGKKVLLAEDDAVNRKVGQRLLRSLNCDVTVTCNGQEALDVLCQVPAWPELPTSDEVMTPRFDLVLMDLQMPVMDGTHAVQLFREWEELQEPPRKRMTIFALTANVSDRDMVKCAQSGFDEFVSKPLTIEKLIERMRNIKNDDIHNRGLDL